MRKVVSCVLCFALILFSLPAFSAQVFQTKYHWSNRGSDASLQYGRICTAFMIILDENEPLDIAVQILNDQSCCCGEVGLDEIIEENPWLTWPNESGQIIFFTGCLPDGGGTTLIT